MNDKKENAFITELQQLLKKHGVEMHVYPDSHGSWVTTIKSTETEYGKDPDICFEDMSDLSLQIKAIEKATTVKKWYYYLHTNGDLIGKNPWAVGDPKTSGYFDSDFVVKYWFIETLTDVINMLDEAMDLGASSLTCAKIAHEYKTKQR